MKMQCGGAEEENQFKWEESWKGKMPRREVSFPLCLGGCSVTLETPLIQVMQRPSLAPFLSITPH